MKRKALGKGLRSLIPEAPPRTVSREAPGEGLRQLDIDQIHPNRGQPRQHFDQAQLEELALSLKRSGVLQPVIVRPYKNGEFELIAGERRWRAAQIAGLMKIPALIKNVPDNQLLEVALIENLQREELNPIEEANAYQTLIDDLGLTQQQIGERVGKQRATIANSLRLLNLPSVVQEKIQDGRISAGHAKALAPLANSQEQAKLADRIVGEGLSVRQVESIVRRRASVPSGKVGEPTPDRDPNVVAAEEALQSAIGTKVRIVPARKGGRLEVHYYSDEELRRVYDMIMGATRKR